MRQIDHLIAGGSPAATGRTHKIWNPSTGEVQAEVVLGDAALLEAAVAKAKEVQPAWAATNPQKRARVMFEFKQLVEENKQELAELLSSEHGKVVDDANGDVQRGLEVIEFACGIPQALKGEYTQGAGPGIDVYSMRQPLGIGAGITPFNFPAMIPMWMFGMAIAAGNAFILKPSERDPSVPVRLAELFLEAGAPEGLLQVVHGDKEMVDAILDHPDIPAISFVGSSDIAHYIYERGAANAKRVQAFGGAKNHGIVMPDADLDQVVNDLAGAAFGSAGERCMALPVVVPVGEDTADKLREKLIPAINALRIGVSNDPDAHYGPVVTPEHKARVEGWIDTAEKEGAEVVIDGRGFSLQGHENGFFVGPTLLDRVTTDMESYRKRSSAPCCRSCAPRISRKRVRLPSEHQYGNGVAIFTRNGHAAREFAQPGECRHGRHQRADPRAGQLSQLRRVEALRLRRHRPVRHGRPEVLDEDQEGHPALARWHGGWRKRERLRHPDDGVMAMRTSLIAAATCCLILPACTANETDRSVPEPSETMIPVEPDGGIGDGAPPLDELLAEEPSAFASTFPEAIRGTWRETDGPAPTATLCDNTAAANMGKVLNVREDSYSYFENGGRFITVSERSPGSVRAVFDTTYADTPTQDELTFSVDPVAKTLTVTNHDDGERGRTVFKRCPQ